MIYASARGNRYERVRCPNWPRLAAGNRDTPAPPATPCCLQRLAAVGANLWRLGCVASWPRLLRAINRRAFAMQTTRSPPATPTASRTPGRQDMSQMKAVEGRFACNWLKCVPATMSPPGSTAALPALQLPTPSPTALHLHLYCFDQFLSRHYYHFDFLPDFLCFLYSASLQAALAGGGRTGRGGDA